MLISADFEPPAPNHLWTSRWSDSRASESACSCSRTYILIIHLSVLQEQQAAARNLLSENNPRLLRGCRETRHTDTVLVLRQPGRFTVWDKEAHDVDLIKYCTYSMSVTVLGSAGTDRWPLTSDISWSTPCTWSLCCLDNRFFFFTDEMAYILR